MTNLEALRKILAEPAEGEYFTFGSLRFDVYQAHMLLQTGKIKNIVDQLPVEAYLKSIHAGVKRGQPYDKQPQNLFININWKHVATLESNDLTRPGILVESKFGHVLIDGNHRLMRSAMENAQTMPVQIITKKDVLKITPGTKAYLAAKKELRDIAKKKGLEIKAFDVEGDPSKIMHIGELSFDQHSGLGQIPYNEEIKYYGVAVLMTPQAFFKLTPAANFNDAESIKTVKYITAKLKKGEPIGSPFLDVSFNKKKHDFHVTGHEGRHRMKAIADLYGQVPVLVHIILPTRVKDFPIERLDLMRMKMVPQYYTKAIAGPFFGRKVFFIDKWTTIGEPTPAQAALVRIMTAASTDYINKKYKMDLLSRIRDAIDELDFFAGDIGYIEKFEGLLRSLSKPAPKTKEEN